MVQVRKRLLRSDRFFFIALQKSSCYTEPEQKSTLHRRIWARFPVPNFLEEARWIDFSTAYQPYAI